MYYQVTIPTKSRCIVHILNRTITNVVEFDATNGKIDNIDTSFKLKGLSYVCIFLLIYNVIYFSDNATPLAKYILRKFLKRLSNETLVSCLGQHFDILSFLDYVHLTVCDFTKLFEEYEQLVKNYGFTMHDDMRLVFQIKSFVCACILFIFYRVTFTVINKELMLVWDVEVNYADEQLSENSVKVCARLGNVNERAVKRCVQECPQGFTAFTSFALNIKNYMGNLKRNVKS